MRRLARARQCFAGVAVFAIVAASAVSCSHDSPPPSIRVRETDLVVQNQTNAAWSDIEVWVNDHFRGLAPSLQPGQQLFVPLDSLQAAFGRRFDRTRQAVFGVLVTARSTDGSSVRLVWGKVRRR